MLRAGCAWRLLPHDFPPRQTVYHYPRRWPREGVWVRVHHALVLADRERDDRNASPSAANQHRNGPPVGVEEGPPCELGKRAWRAGAFQPAQAWQARFPAHAGMNRRPSNFPIR